MKIIIYLFLLLFTLSGCSQTQSNEFDKSLEIIVTENKDQYHELFKDYALEQNQELKVTQISTSELNDLIERNNISESTDVIIFPSSSYLEMINNSQLFVKLPNNNIANKFHYDNTLAFAYDPQLIITNGIEEFKNYQELANIENESNIISLPITSQNLKLVFNSVLETSDIVVVEEIMNSYVSNLAQVPIENEMEIIDKINNGYAKAAIVSSSKYQEYTKNNSNNNIKVNELDNYAVDLKLITFTNNSNDQLEKINQYMANDKTHRKLSDLNIKPTMSNDKIFISEYKKINKININNTKMIEQLPVYNR